MYNIIFNIHTCPIYILTYVICKMFSNCPEIFTINITTLNILIVFFVAISFNFVKSVWKIVMFLGPTYEYILLSLQLNSNGESRGVQKKLRQQLTLWGLITIWSFDYVLQQKLGLLSLCAKRLKNIVKYKH